MLEITGAVAVITGAGGGIGVGRRVEAFSLEQQVVGVLLAPGGMEEGGTTLQFERLASGRGRQHLPLVLLVTVRDQKRAKELVSAGDPDHLVES